MSILPAAKWLLRFYVDASLHVAAAVAALGMLTRLFFGYDAEPALAGFIFFSSLPAYNLAKYREAGGLKMRLQLPGRLSWRCRAVLLLSILSAAVSLWLAAGFSLLRLSIAAAAGLLTLLYVWPAIGGYSLRSLPGLKIFIIALSWTLIAVFLPLAGADVLFSRPVLMHAGAIFCYVLAAMIPFEIRDAAIDAPGLRTLPQTFGLHKVRHIGGVWASLTLGLTLLNSALPATAKWTTAGISLLLILLIYGASSARSFWYAAFWVEALPLLWLFTQYI